MQRIRKYAVGEEREIKLEYLIKKKSTSSLLILTLARWQSPSTIKAINHEAYSAPPSRKHKSDVGRTYFVSVSQMIGIHQFFIPSATMFVHPHRKRGASGRSQIKCYSNFQPRGNRKSCCKILLRHKDAPPPLWVVGELREEAPSAIVQGNKGRILTNPYQNSLLRVSFFSRSLFC